MSPQAPSRERMASLKARLAYSERVKEVMNRIHAARDLDQLFTSLVEDVLGLLGAEHVTLYAVDQEKREIYSRYLDIEAIREIRLPLNAESLAGFAASRRLLLNIADAYDREELAAISPDLRFDASWDERTGVTTRQVLAVPLLAPGSVLAGLLQLINKKGGGRFSRADEHRAQEIGKPLAMALANQYRLAARKSTKFDELVTLQLITSHELEAAIREARERRKPVETVLLEKHKISKRELGAALSAFYRCPFVEYDERRPIPLEQIQTININYLKANHWLPLRADPHSVEVLVEDPHSFQILEDIRQFFPRSEIQIAVGLREDILKYLERAEAGHLAEPPGEPLAAIIEQLGPAAGGPCDPAAGATVSEGDGAILRLFNRMMADACELGASDIHIEPYGNERETVIRFRIDGICREYARVPPGYHRPLASCIKIMAGLDIADRRKPQDGKIKLRLARRSVELRVATIPTAGVDNEDIVLRMLAASEPIPLDRLNMLERNLRELKRLLEKPYGLILCVGPTGSGKTTTLHSALGYLNTPETKIWTAEDPVEITQVGLRQVQVRPKIGYGFAAALRAFLRADPDVIMVGEIRDRETAEICLEASLTGHLVLSTLHTNSAAETVTRLLEIGMDPFHFADALLGVLAQRLVRALCPHCRGQHRPSTDEADALARFYGTEAFSRLLAEREGELLLYRPAGCDACGGSGYKGRTGLHELLVAGDTLKRLIHARAPAEALRDAAIEGGMVALAQDGIRKALDGWTDFQQVQGAAMK